MFRKVELKDLIELDKKSKSSISKNIDEILNMKKEMEMKLKLKVK